MSGFFGCVSRNECVNDVFYGTDYHSHLGTKRAGMASPRMVFLQGLFTHWKMDTSVISSRANFLNSVMPQWA